MNETVAKVIEAEKKRARRSAAEQKRRFLLEHGLYREEYSDGGYRSKIPLEVTDEEYEALLEVFPYDEAGGSEDYRKLTYESVESVRKMVKFFVVIVVIMLVLLLIETLVSVIG